MYDHTKIEERWQKFWEEKQLFQGMAGEENDPKLEKMFLLFAFAYPSGSGLHVGHVESKTALDIMARYYRMNGRQVMFPVGWDAFGLPAENYAIKTGIPPAQTTKSAIDTFRTQIKRLAISYDWAGEIATSHPGYYNWTQWLFLQLYKKGFAYQDTGLVNWCPSCQTVLANEQVVEGVCERCETEVIQKEMKQWYFKITQYQDELISGLDKLDWPGPTKQQQLNWIGKSEGVTYTQKVKGMDITLESYDSVPQTYMAQTFCVIAPEHKVVSELVAGTDREEAVTKFVEEFKKRKMKNRFKVDKEVEGIFTGQYIENPFGTGDLPIWIATFVIKDYGTGFVNSSAHDERDFEFAKKYDIPLRPVMFPEDKAEEEKVKNLEYCYHHVEDGVLAAPEQFKGRRWGEVREDIIEYINTKGIGKATTQYKLRDWLISRQRYWGVPIPIVYDPDGKPHPVKEEHLPWKLPEDVDFNPTGESPLKSSKEFFARTEKLYGKGWTPEVDTMDTFVDSSWYYLRYCDPRNEQEFASKDKLKQWSPVDFYMIGPEHIVLHLLYSRFFTKFLRDEGYLDFDEPFLKMRHQGMILGPDGKKMSKSKGNVISPDDVIEKFGADTLRIYEMFMGPIDADKPWDARAVIGIYKFLRRIYDLAEQSIADGSQSSSSSLTKKLHQTIQKVTSDVPKLKFNTAIASLMELVNLWEKDKQIAVSDLEKLVLILAPFAPFMTEDIYWQIQGNEDESIHKSSWPQADPELAKEESVNLPVQVNGKVRAQFEWPSDDLENKEKILQTAKKLPQLEKWLENKQIVKEIYVPGKIVSLSF
jgi:leucyl-tRNA synthetase